MARPLCKCGLCSRRAPHPGAAEEAPERFVAGVVADVVKRHPDGFRELEAAVRLAVQLGWRGRAQAEIGAKA